MTSPTTDERRLFDQLCLYRALYERRGARDRVSLVPLAEAVRRAEAQLARLSGQPTARDRAAASS